MFGIARSPIHAPRIRDFDKRWVKKNTIDVDANDTGSSRKLAKMLLRAMDKSVKSIEDISQDDQYVLEKLLGWYRLLFMPI